MTMWPIALAFVAASATISPAAAQGYPSRPITIVVPFPAGGAFDTVGRIVADRMVVSLGQPIIIENVGGAAGSIGVGRVARASPDGIRSASASGARTWSTVPSTRSRMTC